MTAEKTADLDERLLPPTASDGREDLNLTFGTKGTKTREIMKMEGFPKPVYLGTNSPRYFKSEVIAWLKQLRDQQQEAAA